MLWRVGVGTTPRVRLHRALSAATLPSLCARGAPASTMTCACTTTRVCHFLWLCVRARCPAVVASLTHRLVRSDETCDYSDPSATCSLVGTTFYDVASLGDSTISATVGFGGIQEHQGAFDNEWTNMPGVMGMGYPRLAAVWRNNTVFNSWVEAGDLAAVFGMCINDTIGHLTLGAIDARYYTGDLVFTPVVDQAWCVELWPLAEAQRDVLERCWLVADDHESVSQVCPAHA